MVIVTRWVGLCCLWSAALVVACDGGSTSANSAAAGSGVGGDGNAGTANGDSGAGNTSSNTGGSPSSSAGTGPSDGGTHSVGTGGSSDSGAGAGGKLGSGGSGVAGAAQGGAGGTPGGGSCGGAQVLFLIQRSGALFERPLQGTSLPTPLEASYFGFLQAALVGDGSAAKPYAGKLPIGVSFLFAARDLQVSPIPAMCPQLAATAPSLHFDGTLSTAFTQGAADHNALVTAKLKAEAPVPEGIASAVASWSTSGARHLVLVTMGMPDTCTKFDGPCGIDATLKAVQDAKAAGVSTHVIGLDQETQFNYTISNPDPVSVQTGYEEYLQQLANAGADKPVGPDTLEHKLNDFICDGATTPAALTAAYSAAAGDAKFYRVMTATDAKTAVADILAKICP